MNSINSLLQRWHCGILSLIPHKSRTKIKVQGLETSQMHRNHKKRRKTIRRTTPTVKNERYLPSEVGVDRNPIYSERTADHTRSPLQLFDLAPYLRTHPFNEVVRLQTFSDYSKQFSNSSFTERRNKTESTAIWNPNSSIKCNWKRYWGENRWNSPWRGRRWVRGANPMYRRGDWGCWTARIKEITGLCDLKS